MKNEAGLFARYPYLATLLQKGTIQGDVFRIYGFQISGLALALLGNVIVARTLGPTEKGLVDLFTLITSLIVEIGLLGFGSGLLYSLSHKRRPLGVVHGTGIAFCAWIGLLVGGLGWALRAIWLPLFPGIPVWMVGLSLALSPILFYRLIWNNLLVGTGLAVSAQKSNFSIAVLNLIAVGALLWSSQLTSGTAVISNSVVLTVITIAGGYFLYIRDPALRPEARTAFDAVRSGLIIYVGLVANILHFKIDQLMLNYWLGPQSIGIYAVSVRWAEMLLILDNALISASLSKISSLPRDQSHALTWRLTKAQALVSAGAGLALCLVAIPLIQLLYGIEYSSSAMPLILLVPGIVSWSLAKVMSQYITFSRGAKAVPTIIAVAALFLNTLMNYWLIPLYGVKGAAVASSLSYSLVMLLTVAAFFRLK